MFRRLRGNESDATVEHREGIVKRDRDDRDERDRDRDESDE